MIRLLLRAGVLGPRLRQKRNLDNLKIGQRVVTFDEGPPLRGTVRFTGEIKDSSGEVQIVVGLELDERHGDGSGTWKGHQLFECRRDHACFVGIETVMLEEDFDKDPKMAKKRTSSQRQDKQPRDLKMQEVRHNEEMFPRSLSYNIQQTSDEQFEENASSRQSTSLDSASIVPARESKMPRGPFISATSSDIHQLKGEDKRLKLKKNKGGENKITEVIHLVKERNNLFPQQRNLEKELQKIQQEKDEIVKEEDNLQTDLRAILESQVHAFKTCFTTAQQIMEDIQQLKNENNRLKLEKCQLEKEKNDVQEEKDELVVQNNGLQTDLRAKEAEVHRLETTLTTAQQALEDIQQLKNENERLKLENCQWEREKNDLQEEKDELVVQNNSLQMDLRAKEAEVHRLETTLATAQRALEECQQIKKPCDWVVSRDEVEITDKCLGMGGWGKVVLGTFRGCKVAVKEIHELILSPYNRRLFEREMNIASKCRHPCLLQFIGATNDDGIPLFITELLETSLRALLEQRQLAETEISIISLDVSLALNYLHNMKPSPILHRDVSSANVLLWRQGDQWRGKVSDYGTANFVQQTMTRAPGAVIYSAPEAVSSNQTPKVDVYSFGVLVCEMCIWEMPDPERRNQQVLLVKSHIFRNLVHECLKANPVERPEMSQIIQEIQRFEGLNQMVNKC